MRAYTDHESALDRLYAAEADAQPAPAYSYDDDEPVDVYDVIRGIIANPRPMAEYWDENR